MNKIKNAIDVCLKDVHLDDRFLYKEENIKRFVPKRFFVLVAAVVFLLGTITAAASTSIFGLIVNDMEMPALAPLEIIPVNPVSGGEVVDNHLEKDFDTLGEVCSELGVKLLDSELSLNHPYMLIHYKKIGEGYNQIDVKAFLVGDLKALVYEEEFEGYSWESGEVFQTPVDLKIEILSDESQQPFDTDYLGAYEYVETYSLGQGCPVNLLQDTIVRDTGSKKECIAVFVAGGIRYTLSGYVDINTMKVIVDSMK